MPRSYCPETCRPARLLLERGAKVDTRCLNYAVEYGHYVVAKPLIAYGADVNGKAHHFTKDWTPLQVAATRGHEALVGLLLDHVPRIDLHTYEEEPLDLAREGGHLATAKTLLRCGTPIPRLSGIIRSIY
jgi:ankyrin repeat protein